MSEVTLIAFLKRREGMSPQEFQAYWSQVHAPLVLGTASGHHALHYERRAVVMGGYDGVTIQTFASRDAFEESIREPDYQLIAEDLPKFLDVDAIQFVITEEPVVHK